MSDQMQKIVDALEIGLHSVRGDLARARVEQDKMGWFSERVEIVEGEVVTVQNALAAARKMRDAEPVAIGEIDSCGDGFFVELYPERDLTVGAKVYTAPPTVEASQQQGSGDAAVEKSRFILDGYALRAEVSSLTAERDALTQRLEAAKAEAEALRKDAERWRKWREIVRGSYSAAEFDALHDANATEVLTIRAAQQGGEVSDD